MNGRYQAYTQQGTKINVSEADCKKLINENDRPFNYFASNQQRSEPSLPKETLNTDQTITENL